MRRLLVVPMSMLLAVDLLAQGTSKPIDTDRPDLTESSTLAPRGRVQFEAGYTWTEANGSSGGAGSATWPELLVRYGLSNRFELRVGQSLTTLSPPPGQGNRFTAREDVYLGVKVRLGAQQGSRPALAFLAQATLPTGDGRLSANTTLPGVALLAGWQWSSPWSLDLELGASRVPGDAWELAPSASLGRSFSSRVRGFAELYSLVPLLNESGAPTQHYANSGFAVLLSNNLQLDARVGAGLNDAADRYFVGFGFAIRR